MERYLKIILIFFGTFILSIGSSFARHDDTSTLSAISSQDQFEAYTQVQQKGGVYFKGTTSKIPFDILSSDSEEEEEEVKKRIIRSFNWGNETNFLRVPSHCVHNIISRYSQPKGNPLIAASPYRIHVLYSLYLI